MAKTIRRGSKPAMSKVAEQSTKSAPEVKMSKNNDDTFTVSIGETIPTGDYAGKKIFLSRTKSVVKDIESEMDETAEFLDGKLSEYIEKFVGVQEEEEFEEEAGEEEEEFGEEEEDDEGDDLSEEEIRAMKKPELLKLIKDEELDIDVSKIKKIGDLREAVVNALYVDEDEEGEEEDSEEWEDGEDWEDEY